MDQHISPGPKNDAPLSPEEKALLKEYKNLYSHVSDDDRRQLPRSFLNLWLGNSAATLVRHAEFAAVMERARQNAKEAEAKRQAEILEESRKQAEEELQRKAKRFYDFWYYRGIVYAGQKYWDSNGQNRWMAINFFLQRQGKADQEIKITHYDLPIANGQEVAVIYSSLKGENSGSAVMYCNFNTRQSISLRDGIKKLERKRPECGHNGSKWIFYKGISYEEELNEFMRKTGLK